MAIQNCMYGIYRYIEDSFVRRVFCRDLLEQLCMYSHYKPVYRTIALVAAQDIGRIVNNFPGFDMINNVLCFPNNISVSSPETAPEIANGCLLPPGD